MEAQFRYKRRKYLDEEACQEEKPAENRDVEGARKHGVLKGFYNLACARGWERGHALSI